MSDWTGIQRLEPPLTLSQTMRRGIAQTQPNKAFYFDRVGPDVLKACALGAIWYGATGLSAFVARFRLFEWFPELGNYTLFPDAKNCPAYNSARALADQIAILNDYCGWDRGKIAKWIEDLGY